jgi:hypothetical protein
MENPAHDYVHTEHPSTAADTRHAKQQPITAGSPQAAHLLRRRLSRESDRLLSLSLREPRSRDRSLDTSLSFLRSFSFSLSFFLLTIKARL